MSLPRFTAAYETVTVEGEEVKIRSLTRGEAYRIQRMVADDKGNGEVEVAILAYGTDSTVEEARAWQDAVPTYVVDPIILAIKRLSRLDEEGTQKSGGDSDRPG